MRTLLLGAAALALGFSAQAQAANDTNNSQNNSNGQFITRQDAGIVRAPKLVGVAVYDKDNKSVGKISDILLDKQGKVEAVVIGIGGFLGIGTKDIALPYNDVKWQTEQRTVATNGTAPGAMNGANTTTNTGGAMTGTGTAANNAAMNHGAIASNAATPRTVTPAEQEAYNGYPDRAVVDMSQQQLKDAPEFKYASQTANSAADVNKGDAAKQ